jgi:hypothetical protein
MVVLVTACDSEPTQTDGTPELVPSFEAIRAQYESSEVATIYYAEIQGVSGELLWRRSGEVDRWDFFFEDRRGCCGWESVLATRATTTSPGQVVEACSWSFESRKISQPECGIRDSFSFGETLEPPLYLMDLEPSASRDVLGTGATAYCYVSEQLPKAAAYVCFAGDGRLIDLVVQFGVRGPAWLRAKDVWVDEPGVQLAELPRSVVQGAPIDALTLPMLPALRSYLEGEDDPIRAPE